MVQGALKYKNPVTGSWVEMLAGRDGAQGPAGPASPHEGSNIATSVKAFGAVGDGTVDDTADVQAALTAAAGTYVDFEAGTYLVTGNLGMGFWENRTAGPGIITDGAGTTFRITPRDDTDVNTIWVNGDTGDDGNDGISPTRPLKTLAGVKAIFDVADAFDRGSWTIRLSGTITGGMRFQSPPFAKSFLRFEGDALDSNDRPTTWIESANDPAQRFGLRFEEGQNQRVHLSNIGFRGFNTGGGAGWIMKSGGFIRTEDCWTENCQIGSIYTGNVGFSEQRSTHEGYTTSGTRAQYNSSGTWTECNLLGGPAAREGFHISRNSVAHVDYCTSENHTVYGGWQDMSTRVSWKCSTFRNNGSRGIRAEGGSDCHIDMTLPHNVFENNTKQDVSIRGTARLAAEEGIYAIPEHLVDTRVVNSTTGVTAQRGLNSYRLGQEARMNLRAWGTGAGTLTFTAGGSTIVGRTVSGTGWIVEVTMLHDGTGWQVMSTVNGSGVAIGTATAGTGDAIPAFVPSGGATLRGIEVRTGG